MQMSELVPSFTDVFRIVRGVGQGLPHAGDIADLIWQEAVELYWAASVAVQHRLAIHGYFRFRDDMIIFAAQDADHVGVAEYLEGIKTKAGALGYIVKVEFVDLQVPFLNVLVTADHSRGRYVTSLYKKPNAADSVPLDPRSGQAWHVHSVWPKSQLGVAKFIEGSAVRAAGLMVETFNKHCIDPPPIAVQTAAGVDLPIKIAKDKKP